VCHRGGLGGRDAPYDQPVKADDLIARHPSVFHTADARAWPSIRAQGLLPAAMLLEACGARTIQQPRQRRTTSQVLTMTDHVDHTVVVRDQLPLKFLDRVLENGTSREEYLDILDERCFFWASEERLLRLLHGKMYRKTPQVVLTVNTATLVDAYRDKIELSPYNSGSAHVPTAPKRGKETFQPIDRYDYQGWRQARGRSGDALVEFTVVGPVPDIMDHVSAVRHFPGAEFQLA
jgi:hypothetical protein